MMQMVREGLLLRSKYSAVPAKRFGCGETRNVVRRGASQAAASVPSPSDSPKRKRVSKDERRALIQSFVTRYRSMNAGKFPSASTAQKEVGGSYYVVRKILQELEYKSKLCASNSSYENLSGKVLSKGYILSSVVEVVLTAVRIQDDTCPDSMDDVKMLDTNEKQVEADGVLQVYTLAEETSSEGVLKPQTPGSYCEFVLEENGVLKGDAKSLEKQEDDKVENAGIDSSEKNLTVPDKEKIMDASDQHLESEELCKKESNGVQSDFGVVDGDLLKDETKIGNEECDKKEQTVSKELLNAGSPELKTEHQQQFAEEEKYARNLSSEQTNDAESSTKSTLWGNLKSFADGIINIWRKL
ncbi:hypothetical protein REPUB_Repub08aG0091400 [Reevesia pubescens]